jgi:hypothetical protein
MVESGINNKTIILNGKFHPQCFYFLNEFADLVSLNLPGSPYESFSH